VRGSVTLMKMPLQGGRGQVAASGARSMLPFGYHRDVPIAHSKANGSFVLVARYGSVRKLLKNFEGRRIILSEGRT
jgi:hypothetical protein